MRLYIKILLSLSLLSMLAGPALFPSVLAQENGTGIVRVQVLDKNGQPLKGATITLLTQDEKLAAAAHIVCPYSHAMRTSTEVPVTVA